MEMMSPSDGRLMEEEPPATHTEPLGGDVASLHAQPATPCECGLTQEELTSEGVDECDYGKCIKSHPCSTPSSTCLYKNKRHKVPLQGKYCRSCLKAGIYCLQESHGLIDTKQRCRLTQAQLGAVPYNLGAEEWCPRCLEDHKVFCKVANHVANADEVASIHKETTGEPGK